MALEKLTGVQICGMVCNAGPNLEPLACAYREGHEGEHSWATLPTFVNTGSGDGAAPSPRGAAREGADVDDESPRPGLIRRSDLLGNKWWS